jgi:AraC family transcriptional regulator
MSDVTINPAFPMPSTGSVILHGRAKEYHCEEYAGALSIKSVVRGQAFYEAAGARFCVDESAYLVLNQGRTYSMEFRSPTVVETFCLFFHPGLVADVLRARTASPEHLLDDPFYIPVQSVDFFERMVPHDAVVSPLLKRLHRTMDHANPIELEETLPLIVERLLETHRHLAAEAEKIPAVRTATRQELYRRLHYARDFMDACLQEPLRLEQVAVVACMSPHHFLRQFKQMFQETPHQYLTRKRLAKAQFLLRTTEQPVYTVALEIGLQSAEGFIRLFQTQYGLSPTQFRLRCRASK